MVKIRFKKKRQLGTVNFLGRPLLTRSVNVRFKSRPHTSPAFGSFLSIPKPTSVSLFSPSMKRPAASFYGDSDKDGVMNAFDCAPRNPRRQGPQHIPANAVMGRVIEGKPQLITSIPANVVMGRVIEGKNNQTQQMQENRAQIMRALKEENVGIGRQFSETRSTPASQLEAYKALKERSQSIPAAKFQAYKAALELKAKSQSMPAAQFQATNIARSKPIGGLKREWSAVKQNKTIKDIGNSPMKVMRNPAATFAQQWANKIGGTYQIRTDAQGNQYGGIITSQGNFIDEWDLYRHGRLTR